MGENQILEDLWIENILQNKNSPRIFPLLEGGVTGTRVCNHFGQ